MESRILLFPAPRTLVFRRWGPFRLMAFLMLLMISAGFVALLIGFGPAPRPAGGEGNSAHDPLTLVR